MDKGTAFGESMNFACSGDCNSEIGVFECNICFELAQDPIVTLCGHLYCWPCLYKWLHFNSYSPGCPVCKALIREEKLVPIYGRGKSSSDQRIRFDIPTRPTGQRPETAPTPSINYFREDELGSMGRFMPMSSARFGNLTFSAFFGAIPSLFNLQVHGFHDATVYGATSGVPYLFSSSYHGGYAHGFHQDSFQGYGSKLVLKIFILFLGLLLILTLISISAF